MSWVHLPAANTSGKCKEERQAGAAPWGKGTPAAAASQLEFTPSKHASRPESNAARRPAKRTSHQAGRQGPCLLTQLRPFSLPATKTKFIPNQ